LISFKVLFLSRVSSRALPVLSVKPMQQIMKRACREGFFLRCRSNRKNSLVRHLRRRRQCAFIIALVECQILKSLVLQDSSAKRNATGLQCKDANVRAVQGEADEGDEDEAVQLYTCMRWCMLMRISLSARTLKCWCSRATFDVLGGSTSRRGGGRGCSYSVSLGSVNGSTTVSSSSYVISSNVMTFRCVIVHIRHFPIHHHFLWRKRVRRR
jgi:hypothetical protein